MRLRPAESEAAAVQQRIEAKFGSRAAAAVVLVERQDAEAVLRDAEEIAGVLDGLRKDGLLASASGVEALLPSVRTQERRLARFNAIDRRGLAARLREALPRHGFKVERFRNYLEQLQGERTRVVRPGDPLLGALQPVFDRHLRQRGGRWIAATYVRPAPGVPLERVAAELRERAVSHRFASRALLELELGAVLRREFAGFAVLATAANLLLLWGTFRSLRTALAVLAPTLAAVLALFAFMALAGVPLDPVNLVVVPMVLGVGVDYGVYVAAAARREPVGVALRRSGRALVVTAFTTIAGFGFLALSHYPALAWLGILSGIGLLAALVLTVVLLPAIVGNGAGSNDGNDSKDNKDSNDGKDSNDSDDNDGGGAGHLGRRLVVVVVAVLVVVGVVAVVAALAAVAVRP